jgi:hypothetical protein
MAMNVVGAVHNFVRHPGATPAEWASQEGLVFVAMDAREWANFPGSTLRGDWVVWRDLHAELALDPWPSVDFRFTDERPAREAYQALRNHVLTRIPGVVAHPDNRSELRLHDPTVAWSEVFSYSGQALMHLGCDRLSEARLLEMTTDRLGPFVLPGQSQARGLSYSSQTAPHLVAATQGPTGAIDHLLVAFTPGGEGDEVQRGMPRSVLDLGPFDLEVPSGVMILAWARLDGTAMLGQTQGDPAAVVSQMIGNAVIRHIPTPLDSVAPGPLGWAIRVRPGRFRAGLRFHESEQGISAVAISHEQAAPLWPDLTQGAAPAYGAAPVYGGDDDPQLFPGQPVPRLSDYVRLMKAMQTGDMNGALHANGLDMTSYGAVAQRWGMRMASDPGLMARFSAAMTR